jgi:flagellar hook-basal body protein
MQALRTAATGMAAQQLNVEVISNNIANMNTMGFKRQRAEFQDLIYQNVERMPARSRPATAPWCRPASRSAAASRPARSTASPSRARPP